MQLHQHTRYKDWKPKPLSSEKKTLAILGERSIDSEDPLEHIIDGTSSEEEVCYKTSYLAIALLDYSTSFPFLLE